MARKFKHMLVFVIAVFITVMSSIILPLLSYVNPQSLNNINMKFANADVGVYDLSEGDKVSLVGEWEFYWDKHLVSQGLENEIPDSIVDMPSPWSAYEIHDE